MMVWLPPAVLCGLLIVIALAAEALRRRYSIAPDTLIDAVDRLLPQTQCAQCGYAGCKPYAAAIVAGEAALNLCPPGGTEVHQQLQALMGDESTTADLPPVLPRPAVAKIDEQSCIGCALCLPPCPVDAIVGAAQLSHTVIAAECTGCELCVDACPVDCIAMVEVMVEESEVEAVPVAQPVLNTAFEAPACIRCGRCDPVCPVDLPVQDLIALVTTGDQLPLADQHGLSQCIECRRCDRICPSEIPLAAMFAAHKRTLTDQVAQARARSKLKDRYSAHQQRMAASQAEAAAKRAQRLARRSR